MRRLILFLLFFVMIGAVHAQFTYGTTGLLNMPTADMQRDKTFMFGGGFLEKHATPARWSLHCSFRYSFVGIKNAPLPIAFAIPQLRCCVSAPDIFGAGPLD